MLSIAIKYVLLIWLLGIKQIIRPSETYERRHQRLEHRAHRHLDQYIARKLNA